MPCFTHVRFLVDLRIVSRVAPMALLGIAVHHSSPEQQQQPFTSCDAAAAENNTKGNPHNLHATKYVVNDPPNAAGMVGGGDEQGSYQGMFPKRQLWQPKLPYPLWDREIDQRYNNKQGRKKEEEVITRHIILVRHGQYDETHSEDEKRILTKLGREQADLTGKRLQEVIRGVVVDSSSSGGNSHPPHKVKIVCVSNMARAKETADIIARHFPGVNRADPDPLLNEGIPAHPIPTRFTPPVVDEVDNDHPRIEAAFEKYICRGPNWIVEEEEVSNKAVDDCKSSASDDESKHQFEIIVCHGNVIRYFFCRALQLPPEAWLRMSIFNCSLTYLCGKSIGSMSCRMLGDIGHLGYGKSSFSMNHGFNWE